MKQNKDTCLIGSKIEKKKKRKATSKTRMNSIIIMLIFKTHAIIKFSFKIKVDALHEQCEW